MDQFGELRMLYPSESSYVESSKATLMEIAARSNLPITKDLESEITKLCWLNANNFKSRMKRGGVPAGLVTLFSLKTKKDAQAWIKKLVFTSSCLARLTSNCDRIGFTYRRKYKEFISSDTYEPIQSDEIISVEESGEIKLRDHTRVLKQLNNRHSNRKLLTVYLFERQDEWHLFYFTPSDMYAPAGLNHYKGGPHIHYISYLWGDHYNKEELWQQFENRGIKIKSEHIRFKNVKLHKNIKMDETFLQQIPPQNAMIIDDRTMCYRENNESDFLIFRKK